jgi:hypothetical protein
VFVAGKPFQPSLMLLAKSKNLERNVFQVVNLGMLRPYQNKHLTRLERLARDKRSSFSGTFANYGHKRSYNIALDI